MGETTRKPPPPSRRIEAMNALEELQDKPREERTPLENCIVDAATLEEAERDGEVEWIDKAAHELRFIRANEQSLITVNDELHSNINTAIVALKKAKSVFDAAYVDEDLRLAEKYIDVALSKLDDRKGD
jgi:hypothetical protein